MQAEVIDTACWGAGTDTVVMAGEAHWCAAPAVLVSAA